MGDIERVTRLGWMRRSAEAPRPDFSVRLARENGKLAGATKSLRDGAQAIRHDFRNGVRAKQ